MLTSNKIWIQRTKNISCVSPEEAIEWGYTGPLSTCDRCATLDLRRATPYYFYDQMDFDVPVGTTGDVYDR